MNGNRFKGFLMSFKNCSFTHYANQRDLAKNMSVVSAQCATVNTVSLARQPRVIMEIKNSLHCSCNRFCGMLKNQLLMLCSELKLLQAITLLKLFSTISSAGTCQWHSTPTIIKTTKSTPRFISTSTRYRKKFADKTKIIC